MHQGENGEKCIKKYQVCHHVLILVTELGLSTICWHIGVTKSFVIQSNNKDVCNKDDLHN